MYLCIHKMCMQNLHCDEKPQPSAQKNMQIKLQMFSNFCSIDPFILRWKYMSHTWTNYCSPYFLRRGIQGNIKEYKVVEEAFLYAFYYL